MGALAIHLLGPPVVRTGGRSAAPPRGRKAWALLAYLLAQRRPVPRERLAALLFEDAEDPLGALRWNLSELRRLLGSGALPRGSAVALELPRRAFVDVHAALEGEWQRAAVIPGLGRDLLEGMAFPSSPSFEAWLTNERRHLQAASEAVLTEAARASLAAGDPGAAADHAARLVALDPFHEHAQALLIRAYAVAGDGRSAARQLASCRALMRRELGREPGPAVLAAVDAQPVRPAGGPRPVSARARGRAQLEVGEAAIRAGAVDAGLDSLRRAVGSAAACADAETEATATLALALARFESGRSIEEQIVTDLHRALGLAERAGARAIAGRARLVLAYVEELAGRYDRAERWLVDAATCAAGRLALEIRLAVARCRIERGDYAAAVDGLETLVADADAAGEADLAVWARNQLGRAALERGELGAAIALVGAAAGDAQALGLTLWLPLPLGLLGHAHVLRGDLAAARDPLERGLALAAHVDDPCWQALNLAGLGLLAAATDGAGEAMRLLEQARRHVVRGPTVSTYLFAWVTDALCRVAVAADAPAAAGWAAELETTAARAGMRDLLARAHLHRHALGDAPALAAARVVAAEVDSPALAAAVERAALRSVPAMATTASRAA